MSATAKNLAPARFDSPRGFSADVPDALTAYEYTARFTVRATYAVDPFAPDFSGRVARALAAGFVVYATGGSDAETLDAIEETAGTPYEYRRAALDAYAATLSDSETAKVAA